MQLSLQHYLTARLADAIASARASIPLWNEAGRQDGGRRSAVGDGRDRVPARSQGSQQPARRAGVRDRSRAGRPRDGRTRALRRGDAGTGRQRPGPRARVWRASARGRDRGWSRRVRDRRPDADRRRRLLPRGARCPCSRRREGGGGPRARIRRARVARLHPDCHHGHGARGAALGSARDRGDHRAHSRPRPADGPAVARGAPVDQPRPDGSVERCAGGLAGGRQERRPRRVDLAAPRARARRACASATRTPVPTSIVAGRWRSPSTNRCATCRC